MEPFFIDWFQGIEFEIQGSKYGPRVPRLRERRREKEKGMVVGARG